MPFAALVWREARFGFTCEGREADALRQRTDRTHSVIGVPPASRTCGGTARAGMQPFNQNALLIDLMPRQVVPNGEVKELRREASALKEVVADLVRENRLLKNVWPAPSARWSMKMPVSGLHKRVRHVGAVAAAKMESRTPRAS